VNRPARRVSDRLERRCIAVPDALSVEIDQLVESFARRNQEPEEDVRRAVEVSVLRRGIEALKREESKG
jgi:hypothetical protein